MPRDLKERDLYFQVSTFVVISFFHSEDIFTFVSNCVSFSLKKIPSSNYSASGPTKPGSALGFSKSRERRLVKLQRTRLDSLKVMRAANDLGREEAWVFLNGLFSNGGPFGNSFGLASFSNPLSGCIPNLERWRRKILLSKISKTLYLDCKFIKKESGMNLGFLI